MTKQKLKPYLLILPAMLLAFLFVYYPIVKTFISSFFNLSFNGKLKSFAFFNNYLQLFKRPEALKSLLVTLRFTLFFVPSNILIILFAALLCEKKEKYSKFFETAFFLPLALSLSSAALAFKFIFNPSLGIVNSALKINIDWVNTAFGANLSLIFLGIFLDFGLDFILLLSALRSLDKNVIDAASLDGANALCLILKIKLPLIKPTLSFLIFISIRDALLMAVPPMILTEGGPLGSTTTLLYYYYNLVFRSNSYGQGAALSSTIFIICLIVIFIFNRFKTNKTRGLV